MSAPRSCRDPEYLDGNFPKWKNPCGQEYFMDNSSGGSSSAENDSVIMNSVSTAANIALEYMVNFRESYVELTFGVTYEQQLNNSKQTFDWLPNKETEVPKDLGEKVKLSHLESLTFDQFLQDVYQWMQMYAIGIEQVVLDQKKMGGRFRHEFSNTESNLRKVLCELRMGMYSKNITPLNKVDRCIMEPSVRNMTQTGHRNLRDWLIFKECMNGLEYLLQVLEYLGAKTS